MVANFMHQHILKAVKTKQTAKVRLISPQPVLAPPARRTLPHLPRPSPPALDGAPHVSPASQFALDCGSFDEVVAVGLAAAERADIFKPDWSQGRESI